MNLQRLTKHIIKKHLLTDEDLFRLHHAEKFCLDLDSSCGQDSEAEGKHEQKKSHLRHSVASLLSITNAQIAKKRMQQFRSSRNKTEKNERDTTVQLHDIKRKEANEAAILSDRNFDNLHEA